MNPNILHISYGPELQDYCRTKKKRSAEQFTFQFLTVALEWYLTVISLDVLRGSKVKQMKSSDLESVISEIKFQWDGARCETGYVLGLNIVFRFHPRHFFFCMIYCFASSFLLSFQL